MIKRLFLKEKQNKEKGQAAPLAAVGVFIMCLTVLATYNLGHAVHQKIKLQNAADSAAYTLAAMEARTFNYIAFLNRVQVAHYNTAMMMQSMVSWAGFNRAMMAAGIDMLVALRGALLWGATFLTPCPVGIRCLYPGPAAMMLGVLSRLRSYNKKLAALYDEGHKRAHQFAQAMAIFNRSVIFHAQLARAALLNVNIISGMQNFIEKNDDSVSFKNGKNVLLNVAVNAALNSLEYYSVFDRSAGINPSIATVVSDYSKLSAQGGYLKSDKGVTDKTKGERAYRVMAEIAHASRAPKFVFNRKNYASFFVPFATPAMAFMMSEKLGNTKFTSQRTRSEAKISAINNDPNADQSAGGKHSTSYVPGEYLSSHDHATLSLGLSFYPGLAYVVWGSTSNKTLGDAVENYHNSVDHYQYQDKKRNGTVGLGYYSGGVDVKRPGTLGFIRQGGKKLNCSNDEHFWPGFAPYFMFKANSDRSDDHGQPSTWIFLNKHHKDIQTRWGSHAEGKAPWYSKFTYTNGKQQAKLDTTMGGKRNSYLFEGLNVIARGMAYYHRPGNWGEHPNFFNPFWRARLAPVGQKLQNVWDKYVTSSINSDDFDPKMQQAIQVLKQAQMDLFTSAITSLITH